MSLIYYSVGILLGAFAGVGIGITIPVLLATITAMVTSQNGSPHWIFLFFTAPIGFCIGIYWGFTAAQYMLQSSDKWQALFSTEGWITVWPVLVIGMLSFITIGVASVSSLQKSYSLSQDIEIQIVEVKNLLAEKKWEAAILALKVPFNKQHLYMQKHIPKDWPNELQEQLSSISPEEIQNQGLLRFLISQFHTNINGSSILASLEYPAYVKDVLYPVLSDWSNQGGVRNVAELTPFENLKLDLILQKSELLTLTKGVSNFPMEKALLQYAIAKTESEKEISKKTVIALYQNGIKISDVGAKLQFQQALDFIIK